MRIGRPGLWTSLLAVYGVVATNVGRFRVIDERALQDVVTWDEKSLFIHNERIMIFSGEFHPFRLPVPSLWLDVFQKVKALGMNTVSFYIDWALLEGRRGHYSAKGVFDLEQFFDAAKSAGIYLIARPGPYINAEASGGGFPGWLQRINGTLRTTDREYLDATELYMSEVGQSIAKAQITNGGPVILYQPENEYTGAANGEVVPDGEYMQYVIDQGRKAGIVVPMISNDQSPNGFNAPGTGVGAVDIYGHDAYYFGPDDCETPNNWPANKISTNFHALHEEQSPLTPFSLVEFQAGCWLPWGGTTYDNCAALLNHEYERVFYKNNLAAGVSIMNLYMTVGGTNWGNLGFPDGYTSYDYASAIAEDRTLTRDKFSELKLMTNFLKVSPSYLDAIPRNMTIGVYADSMDLTVTPLLGNSTASSYYVVRHTDETSLEATTYTLKVKTSIGNVTIPQLGGHLTLDGRDSKVHVTDYEVSEAKIVYSSAEIFTWKKFGTKVVIIVYGGLGEHHEMEIQVGSGSTTGRQPEVRGGLGATVKTRSRGNSVVISWDVQSQRNIIDIDDIKVIMIDRMDAYRYWVPELAKDCGHPGFSTPKTTESSLIVKGAYLIRSACLQGKGLHVTADFNSTTKLEVIGVPAKASSLIINGNLVSHSVDSHGIWTAEVPYQSPDLNLPDLGLLRWTFANSLPEVEPHFDDSQWPEASKSESPNTLVPLRTPTSLFGADYGFNTGYLLFRGRFEANGNESNISLTTQGGAAFGSSAWLDNHFLGSWTGRYPDASRQSNYSLPALEEGKTYIVTVIVEQTGFQENGAVGGDDMKQPRGIIDYELDGHDQRDVSWKLTGNLGAEDYRDHTRGPLNEGGLFAERQGWHQPHPPSRSWHGRTPMEGMTEAGVGFFSAPFDLEIPDGYDVPISVTFVNTTEPTTPYRAQLYINGYQFGKYVNHIGPQKDFLIPEGILNHRGSNWIGLTLWAQDEKGAAVDGLALSAKTPIKSAYGKIKPVPQPRYKKRGGAY